MSDDTRTRLSTTRIQNRSYSRFFGWRNHGLVEAQKISTVSCNRHRPKPKILTATPMVIQRTQRNPGVYQRGAPPDITFQGDILYVYSSVSQARTRRVEPMINQSSYELEVQSRLGRGSVNALTTLAESNESIRTISTNFFRIYEFAKKLKRGDIAGAASVLDINLSRRGKARLKKQDASQRMSNGWLEFWYGIMPIISDVQGAMEHLDQSFAVGQKRSAFGGITRAQMQDLQNLDFAVDPDATQDSTLYAPDRLTIRGEIENKNLRRAQELGLINPLQTVWDLIPLSFVFDWFVNVGGWLSTLTYGAGLSATVGCRVRYSASTTYLIGRGYIRRSENISRQPMIPQMKYHPFLLRNGANHSWKKFATVAALARQRF